MSIPFIKYPGGKRAHDVRNLLLSIYPETYDTYLEPFCGAAACFFFLEHAGRFGRSHDRTHQIVLADADRDLIELYEAVRNAPLRVLRGAIRELESLVKGTSSEEERQGNYRTLRASWSAGDRRPHIQFLLRYLCFNGVFRRNKAGGMNMPPRDNIANTTLPSPLHMQNCMQALDDVELVYSALHDLERDEVGVFVSPTTLVYLDPPYFDSFDQYTPEGFSAEMMRNTISTAAEWAQRGAQVVYTNADDAAGTMRVILEDLWPSATIETIQARRTVSRDGDGRQPVGELIVHENLALSPQEIQTQITLTWS